MDSVRRIRAEAEKRMKEGPWTVTAERPVGVTPEPDPHDYYSEAPYWWPNPDNPTGPFVRKDGQVNPNRFRGQQGGPQLDVRRGLHFGRGGVLSG